MGVVRKALDLKIQENVVFSFLNTSTTYKGYTYTKMIDGVQCTGLGVNVFFPFLDDSTAAGLATAPTQFTVTANNRVVIRGAETGGLALFGVYEFNPAAATAKDSPMLLGFARLPFVDVAATTHTDTATKMIDAGTTGWKIFSASIGSVAANGGLYMSVIDRADFLPGPGFPVYAYATAPGEKATYRLQDSPFTLTSIRGMGIDTATSKIYVLNGTTTVLRAHRFDYSLPITTVGATGITADLYEGSCAVDLPTIAAVLQNDALQVATPMHGPNSGLKCLLYSSASAGYLVRLADLAPGSSVFNIQTWNYVTPLLSINPTINGVSWVDEIDRLLASTAVAAQFITKKAESNDMSAPFGTIHSQYYESGGYKANNLAPPNNAIHPSLPFGGQTTGQIEAQGGWAFVLLTTVGQRGVTAFPLKDDAQYAGSALGSRIITRVFNTRGKTIKGFQFSRKLGDQTLPPNVSYRTSNSMADHAAEGTTPFIEIDRSSSIAIGLSDFTSFAFDFPVLRGSATASAQLISASVLLEDISGSDDEWVWDTDNTSRDGESPTDISFKLQRVYSAAPIEYEVDLIDESENIVGTFSTVADIADFLKSTDGGATFIPLVGVPANTAGHRLKLRVPTPPGGFIRARIRSVA